MRGAAGRLSVVVAIVAVAVLGGAARCTTTEGLPVHTSIYWQMRAVRQGETIWIGKRGKRPPDVGTERGKLPGAWRKIGSTYNGRPVMLWRYGRPNGQRGTG